MNRVVMTKTINRRKMVHLDALFELYTSMVMNRMTVVLDITE